MLVDRLWRPLCVAVGAYVCARMKAKHRGVRPYGRCRGAIRLCGAGACSVRCKGSKSMEGVYCTKNALRGRTWARGCTAGFDKTGDCPVWGRGCCLM